MQAVKLGLDGFIFILQIKPAGGAQIEKINPPFAFISILGVLGENMKSN
jgi:hypothetical protein